MAIWPAEVEQIFGTAFDTGLRILMREARGHSSRPAGAILHVVDARVSDASMHS